jgi:hypothetical protein
MDGWDDVDWTGLAQDRIDRSFCECTNEPLGSIKCWEVLTASQVELSSIGLVLCSTFKKSDVSSVHFNNSKLMHFIG